MRRHKWLAKTYRPPLPQKAIKFYNRFGWKAVILRLVADVAEGPKEDLGAAWLGRRTGKIRCSMAGTILTTHYRT
jgi:hypothetical protein